MSRLEGVKSAVGKCCSVVGCGASKPDDLDDSNVDAVIARNLWKNHRILPPTSPFKNRWDIFMVRAATMRAARRPMQTESPRAPKKRGRRER